ncbi:DNA translocase FtsK 4TM domain-containing protein, partial [Nitratireductor sp. GCM10026969]|uniref:DNA translocase FtsK 4TM domain-containing protein n=1 Tax=Nitratireductor sp. GCM10026969 TaxID=3252645 RepID=UPI00360A8069
MSSGSSATFAMYEGGFGLQSFLRRQVARGVGVALLVLVAFGLASLATWNVADPSLSYATDNPVTNAMGFPGAVFSDIAMQFFGLASVAGLVPAVFWGIFLTTARGVDRPWRRVGAWLAGAVLSAGVAGCLTPPQTWPLPTGLGGVFGDMVLAAPAIVSGNYPTGWFGMMVAALLLGPAVWLTLYGAGALGRKAVPVMAETEPEAFDDYAEAEEEDEDEDGGGYVALGILVHWWLSARAFLRRRFSTHEADLSEEFDVPLPQGAAMVQEPGEDGRIEPDFHEDGLGAEALADVSPRAERSPTPHHAEPAAPPAAPVQQ